MNKNFELEIIDYELESIRKSKIMLMKLLGKNKKRSGYESGILSESLKQSRERENELLDERSKIQETNGTGGNIELTGVTKNNEKEV